jgi:hypothetical protein
MVRTEVDISASAGGFSVGVGGSIVFFLMYTTSRLSVSVSIMNWMEGLKLLSWLRIFYNRSEP